MHPNRVIKRTQTTKANDNVVSLNEYRKTRMVKPSGRSERLAA